MVAISFSVSTDLGRCPFLPDREEDEHRFTFVDRLSRRGQPVEFIERNIGGILGTMAKQTKSHYYFVDEAGTPVIWGRRKQDVLIGKTESKFFIMGLADIRDVTTVSNGIDHLREVILKNPKFAAIPSVQPARMKTARQFHAKDDHPEVRDRVFTLLCQQYHDIRFYAVVRNKQTVLDVIRRAESVDATYRYHPNNLYDTLVRRLFSGRLHYDHGRYSVYFAQRAKSDRQSALMDALQNAQRDYEAYAGVDEKDPPIRFVSGYPHQYQGLQVVDYFCWVLQRLFERSDNHDWKRRKGPLCRGSGRGLPSARGRDLPPGQPPDR